MFTGRLIDISSLPARDLLCEIRVYLEEGHSTHLKSDVCLFTEYNFIHLKESSDLISEFSVREQYQTQL
jgi:hypothetical protein